VFSSSRSGNRNLWIAGRDGSNPTPLTTEDTVNQTCALLINEILVTERLDHFLFRLMRLMSAGPLCFDSGGLKLTY
jgi:hypothetical protein